MKITYAIERHRILGGSSNPLSVSTHHVTTTTGLLRLAKPDRPGEHVRLWATRETATALGYVAENVHARHPGRDDLPVLTLANRIGSLHPATDTRIDIQTVTCKRCGHNWPPRQPMVRVCPKCKSPYWDRERKSRTEVDGSA